MPVNEDLVEARIREANDAVQMLRDLMAKDYSKLTVHERLSMRYLVIQLVEAASSICMHILISVHSERAEGFPECFERIGVKGIVPGDLASRLASAARLRNLLVHRYWAVDDERVYESVGQGLKDFEAFTAHIRSFMEKGGG